MGFEFQEISSLCPWAWPNNNIQKQALLEVVGPDKRRHWHVELDTTDIEFVTVPFALTEPQMLNDALSSIAYSINCLEILLNTKKRAITFREWVQGLDKLSSFGNCSLLIIQEWILDRTLQIHKFPWKPTFAPHITIQHPLEWTIPLYFGLMGFESSDMLKFYASLPYRDLLRSTMKVLNRKECNRILESYTKKLNGLVFLHALALIGLTPAGEDESDEEEALKNAVSNIKTTFQVDPKVGIPLMSRRPFSSMLKDIESFMIGTYTSYFEESIVVGNQGFADFFQVPLLFYATNYGEQFVNKDGTIFPLNEFSQVVGKPFLTKHKNAIITLLAEGVIMTTMIRHTPQGLELMKDFYPNAVNIDKPVHSRHNIIVNSEEKKIKLASSNKEEFDSLSPPWFLDMNNSMGRYKIDKDIDKTYGEAVIEVRGISGLGDWCLDQLQLEKTFKGKFLTNYNFFQIQGVRLFQFLLKFSSETASDIQLGIMLNIENYKM